MAESRDCMVGDIERKKYEDSGYFGAASDYGDWQIVSDSAYYGLPSASGCSVESFPVSSGQETCFELVQETAALDLKSDCATIPPEDVEFPSDEEETQGFAERIAFTQLDDFLRNIQSPFLNYMQPEESGFMDELRAAGAISEGEEDEVRAERTRKDKARKLWFLLHKVGPQLFADKCFPALERLYPHVVCGTAFSWSRESYSGFKCLRHVIMLRLTVQKVADVLSCTNCCSVEEYRELLELKGKAQEQWQEVFKSLQKNCSNAKLGAEIRQLLTTAGVTIPSTFKKQLRSGFPCMCSGLQDRDLRVWTKSQKHWVLAAHGDGGSSHTGYPDTGGSSERRTALTDSESILSSQHRGNAALLMHPTHSHEHEAGHNHILHKYNMALVAASKTRTCFREFEIVRHKLEILDSLATTRSGESASANLCTDDFKDLVRLEEEAQNIRDNAQNLLHSSKDVFKETSKLQETCCSEIPSGPVCPLLKRRYLLEREITEAEGFFKLLSEAFRDAAPIIHRCKEKEKQLQEASERLEKERQQKKKEQMKQQELKWQLAEQTADREFWTSVNKTRPAIVSWKFLEKRITRRPAYPRWFEFLPFSK